MSEAVGVSELFPAIKAFAEMSEQNLRANDGGSSCPPSNGSYSKEDDGEEEIDFSDEPIFSLPVSKAPQRIDIPGLPDSYIVVKPAVTFEVSAGRSRYAKQIQKVGRDRKGRPNVDDVSIEIEYDFMGLFVYKVTHCLDDWQIRDPNSGEVVRCKPADQKHTSNVFRRIRSEKLVKWIGDQIDKVLGWDDEGQKAEAEFS